MKNIITSLGILVMVFSLISFASAGTPEQAVCERQARAKYEATSQELGKKRNGDDSMCSGPMKAAEAIYDQDIKSYKAARSVEDSKCPDGPNDVRWKCFKDAELAFVQAVKPFSLKLVEARKIYLDCKEKNSPAPELSSQEYSKLGVQNLRDLFKAQRDCQTTSQPDFGPDTGKKSKYPPLSSDEIYAKWKNNKLSKTQYSTYNTLEYSFWLPVLRVQASMPDGDKATNSKYGKYAGNFDIESNSASVVYITEIKLRDNGLKVDLPNTEIVYVLRGGPQKGYNPSLKFTTLATSVGEPHFKLSKPLMIQSGVKEMRPTVSFNVYGYRRVVAKPTIPAKQVSLKDSGDVYDLFIDDGSSVKYNIKKSDLAYYTDPTTGNMPSKIENYPPLLELTYFDYVRLGPFTVK